MNLTTSPIGAFIGGTEGIEMQTLVIVRYYPHEEPAPIPEDGPVTKVLIPAGEAFAAGARTAIGTWDGPVLFDDGVILESGWEAPMRTALNRGAYAASPFVRMGDNAVGWPVQPLMPYCWMGWGRQLREWGVFDERFWYGYERLLMARAGPSACVQVEGSVVQLANTSPRNAGVHGHYYRAIQDSATISAELTS